MTSSDDEADDLPLSVSNYHFVDERDELISFSELPVHWTRTESETKTKTTCQVFLHGTADNGLQKVYKQVKAWKFDLTAREPLISVFTKDNNWIHLQKPRKSFEETIRSILITVNCLHFAKRNPETSAKSLWDHLGKTFSLYEVRPSQNDLVDHMELIDEAVRRDNSLAKCQFLLSFLQKKPRKSVLSEEDIKASSMSTFIVDDTVDDYLLEKTEENDSEEEEDLFDTVCAFCDNGGDLLCCDGRCMRSFHATVEAGEESLCDSLGFTKKEVRELENFLCKNCAFNQHQCFACGKLGSSDKSAGVEVIQCANGTCGYYYHPHCVAKLIHPEDDVEAEGMEKKIAAGESFTCSIHKCCVCKQVENKREPDLQFAVCRRCPTAYHRKCLPSDIHTEAEVEGDDIARAWENLLPNRLLIYCLKHEIDDEELGTPIRNHIRFPGGEEKEEKKKQSTPETLADQAKALSKKRMRASEYSFSGKRLMKTYKDLDSAPRRGKIFPQSGKMPSESDSTNKVRGGNDPFKKSLRETTKSLPTKMEKSATGSGNKTSLGDRLFAFMTDITQQEKLGKQDMPDSELNKTVTVKTVAKKLNNDVLLDPASERRLLALMKEAESSVTIEDIIRKKKVPSTHAHSSKMVVDKSITLGKIEGAVEAVRTALKKLEDGCSIEDAKAVCEPEILYQVFRWKTKLKVHLSPFLNGMRYTSFGRHFTKVEKLQEIVDLLHFYVENGDMVVDFCCGANDFSCLMKKKLEETGKKCSFKNYDLFQPKNHFNFEKRDWLTVRPEELKKSGSQLIMGLNPPFGVKAGLANKFIDKALEFKPKLLILIVPPETERLDKKKPPYDLVWEDDQFCSGKSFYLPGSIDANDKQIDQWNLIAPPLYLWSRRDWSSKHKAIAQKHGHPSWQREGSNLGNNHHERDIRDLPVEDCYHNDNDSMLADLPNQCKEPEKLNCGISMDEGHKRNSPRVEGEIKNQDGHHSRKSKSRETSGNCEQRLGKGVGKNLPDDRWNGRKPPAREMYMGMSHHSPSSVVDGRSSVEGPPLRSLEMPSQAEICAGTSGSPMQHRTVSVGIDMHDNLGKTYSTNGDGLYANGIHRSMEQSREHGRQAAENVGYSPHVPEFGRESDVRPQAHLYRQVHPYGQDPDSSVHGNYLGNRGWGYGRMGSLSSSPYGHFGSAAESPYGMNMSAMERYAPRLDELNHTRMNNLGFEHSMLNGNGMYDPRPPQPGYHADAFGFSPGFSPDIHHPYPRNSAGWLNE